MLLKRENLIFTIIQLLILVDQVFASKKVVVQPVKLVFHGEVRDAAVSCHNKTVVCELKFPKDNGNDQKSEDAGDTFRISDIDSRLCTHLLYKFVEVDSESLMLQMNEMEATEKNRNFYPELAALGNGTRSSLKLLLSVGGGGTETVGKGMSSFGQLGENATKQKKFISSVLVILGKYQFHGIDVEWNQPGAEVETSIYDADVFLLRLIKELNESLRPKYLLTISVAGNPRLFLSPLTLKNLSKFVDHFHLQTHDVVLYNRQMSYHHSALKDDDDFIVDWISVKEIMEYYKKHTDPAKLVMKIATHGISFQLGTPSRRKFGLGDNADWAEGFGFREICRNLTTQSGWNTYFDEICRVPFVRRGSQWVSFDDLNSVEEKVDFAVQEGLKGVMVTSIRNDDFDGRACSKSGGDLRKYPVLKTINHRIAKNMGSKCEKDQYPKILGLVLGCAAFLVFVCLIIVVVVIKKKKLLKKSKVFSETQLSSGSMNGAKVNGFEAEPSAEQSDKENKF